MAVIPRRTSEAASGGPSPETGVRPRTASPRRPSPTAAVSRPDSGSRPNDGAARRARRCPPSAARSAAADSRSDRSSSRARGAPTPRPNTARYNDWRSVPVAPPDAFTPELAVSVVVPAYRPDAATLARTLAALERQTYPRELFEVVLVDDGSDPPAALPYEPPFACRIVRQPRRGFGLARARNTGARAASHPVLLFLDSDVLVESAWIAAHARWHHEFSDVVTVARVADAPLDGPLARLDAESVRNRPGSVADLLAVGPGGRGSAARSGEEHLIRTRDLASRADDPFRALLGGNFGIGREFYESLGGHDESFRRWGLEEIEFGYRAYIRGGLFAPVPEAFAWHQGARDAGQRRRDEANLRLQRAKCAHLIADRGIRKRQRGRVFTVPRLVVTIPVGRPSNDNPAEPAADPLLRAVAALLADRFDDLVVRLEAPAPEDPDDREDPEALPAGPLAALRESFGPDPRVFFSSGGAALDDFPASPLHLRLSPAAVERGFRPHLAARLARRLGGAATAGAALPDGSSVTISRAFALHRARRAGGTAGDYGEVKTLSAREIGLGRLRAARPGGGGYPPGYPGALTRFLDRVREVHGPGGFRAFLRWGLAVAGRTLDERRERARAARAERRSRSGGSGDGS